MFIFNRIRPIRLDKGTRVLKVLTFLLKCAKLDLYIKHYSPENRSVMTSSPQKNKL